MSRVLLVSHRPLVALPLPRAVAVACAPSGDDATAVDFFRDEVLTPLFHYRVDRVPLDDRHWEGYQAANARCADAVVREYRPGDVVWVHEHALLLVPALVREKLPEARIGFSLSIPFPSSEIFRVLPWRSEVLRGLLGADLLALQTAEHVRHLASSLRHVLGLEPDVDRVRVGEREARLEVFPASVAAPAWAARAARPDVVARAQALREGAGDARLLFAVDGERDDGAPAVRRLLALERMLTGASSLPRVQLLQVAPPGVRAAVAPIVQRLVASVPPGAVPPVRLLDPAGDEDERAARYLAADVLVATPLRDGMNLRAKEYVATRVHGDGVVVLSEFSGAAPELPGAVPCNPYAIGSLVAAMTTAVTLPPDEQRARMAQMRPRVVEHDMDVWTHSLVDTLRRLPPGGRPTPRLPASPDELAALRDHLHRAERLLLMLDYDGTLQPFAPTPDLAAPDASLLGLLARLSARPGTHVHVVSGRPRDSLDGWLGHLPVGLHAEHGFWSRPRREAPWTPNRRVTTSWREPVRAVLQHFTDATPESFYEEKSGSFAWHYRLADPRLAALHLRELRLRVQELSGYLPVEFLLGEKVVEIRIRGVHKGAVVAPILAGHPGVQVAAFGDDSTDEDMFAALPADGISVHVGPHPSQARYALADPHAVRALLSSLLR